MTSDDPSAAALAADLAAVLRRVVAAGGGAHGEADATDVLAPLAVELVSPVRIGVTGRPNSGVSTVVDALAHRRGAGDVAVTGRVCDRGPLQGVEIVVAPWSDAAGGGASPAAVLAHCDIVLQVVERHATTEDRGVFAALAGVETEHEAGRVRGPRPVVAGFSVLAVLSKVDELDPTDGRRWSSAHRVAGTTARRLHGPTGVVHPVVALLAQSVDCGDLTEEDAAALVRLAAVPGRAALLATVQAVVDHDVVAVPPAARARLLALLGRYGIEVALEAIDGGQRTAAQLASVLRAASGIAPLVDHLGAACELALARRVVRTVATIDRIALRLAPSSAATVLDAVRALDDAPALAAARCLGAVATLVDEPDGLPAALLGPALAELGGAPRREDDAGGGTGPDDWRRHERDPRLSAAGRQVVTTVRRMVERRS